MFEFIKDTIEFDQLIWEFGDENNPDWIHVSYTKDRPNRNRVLRAFRQDGRTKYERM